MPCQNAFAMSEPAELKPRPNKVTRDEARMAKQRDREFFSALKAQGRQAGWRFARADILRQEGAWFISNMPTLAWERGVWNRLTIKPMALDSLFWDIVGLQENNRLPLSFRATGAWVLQPSGTSAAFASEETSPIELARRVVDWSNNQLDALPHLSIDSMLAELGPAEQLQHQRRSLAICLYLLKGDFDEAQRLCFEAGDQRPIMADGGGYTTIHADGTRSTFIEQALRWIADQRGCAS